jgi:ankyrin repeat protein
MTAALRGNQPLVELLLERGAKREISDATHHTALSYALAEGHHEIASLLQNRPR